MKIIFKISFDELGIGLYICLYAGGLAMPGGGGGGGGVLRFDLDAGCAAQASKPIPILKGHFGSFFTVFEKTDPFLMVFLLKMGPTLYRGFV